MKRRLAMLAVLLGLVMSGCEDGARLVARAHGIKVDPFPGTCAPASVQAGYCITTKQESKP